MERFAKIVNGLQSLVVFTKCSILDVLQGSEYVSYVDNWLLFILIKISKVRTAMC